MDLLQIGAQSNAQMQRTKERPDPVSKRWLPIGFSAVLASSLTARAIHPAFFGMKELRSCSLQDELFDRFGEPFFVHSSSDVSG